MDTEKILLMKLKKINDDFEMNLVFFLFSEKNIMPSQYYKMSEGEKDLIRAMFIELMEKRNKDK